MNDPGLYLVQIWEGHVWAQLWYGYSWAEGLMHQQMGEYSLYFKPTRLLTLRKAAGNARSST